VQFERAHNGCAVDPVQTDASQAVLRISSIKGSFETVVSSASHAYPPGSKTNTLQRGSRRSCDRDHHR
jgi:hypothetical protein